MQHHRSVERNGRALQPVSPASYSSSMEVAHYNPAVTPTSSLDFKGRIGESSYNLKTSTELLKVLNRIWSLEEQHASTISLVKALKMELDHSRARIKELLQEKQTERQEMDDLMKQSVRDELEDERKLRKRSETLHRKLARELSEVKSSFSNALRELEREKKARILLEDLCDEFAKGIREYEQEVRSLKHKPEKDRVARENSDRLVLHISEAWLDERMQMKLAEARCDVAEKNTIVDKLSFEIETFLRAKQSAVSAPQNAEDEEDSSDSDSHCFELNKGSGAKQSNGSCKKHIGNSAEGHAEDTVKSYPTKKKSGSQEITKGRKPSGLRTQFEEYMARTIMPEKKNKRAGARGNNCREDAGNQSVLMGHASPIQQWMSKLTSPDLEISESSSKWPRGSRENSLKAKLLEARLEGQHFRAKASKGSF
ncbi:unnamed protein product, partial [Vitis vinifera]